ncbi:MAG: hypothetical protein OXH42_03720 [Acidimicrobiaceae bacterium]|nr:hypothetical protein [Acidimicrobiaceae bacterium]
MTVNIGSVLAAELTASCSADRRHRHVGRLSIDDAVGEDGQT